MTTNKASITLNRTRLLACQCPSKNETVGVSPGSLFKAPWQIPTGDTIFELVTPPHFHSFWVLIPRLGESPQAFRERIAALAFLCERRLRPGVPAEICGPFTCQGGTSRLIFDTQAYAESPAVPLENPEVLCIDPEWIAQLHQHLVNGRDQLSKQKQSLDKTEYERLAEHLWSKLRWNKAVASAIASKRAEAFKDLIGKFLG